MSSSLQRNVRLYPWYQFATGILAWLPVFFLYFNQFVSFAEVIQLGAVYYLFVCICEVPSGYFSDRFGRRLTLVIAGASLSAGYTLFLAASGFSGLAAGQFFMALGIAMMSGSDTAFLYDSLVSLGAESRYEQLEARAQKYSFTASALASLLGGLLGLFDLSLAYVVSLGGAIWATILAWMFLEPPIHDPQVTRETSVSLAMGMIFRKIRQPFLGWLFLVMALMYSLEHLVFEFYQPYIGLLELSWFSGDESPLVAGVVIALSMFGGTLGASFSVRLNRRLGLLGLLVIAFAVQLGILGSLSFTLSVVAVCMVMLRNFPMAMIHAPVVAAIAPRVEREIRATYLSVQSLATRLVFSSWLFLLSLEAGTSSAAEWHSLSRVLFHSLIFGLAMATVLSLFAPRDVRRRPEDLARKSASG